MTCRIENPDLRNINGWGYCCNHLSISRYIHECKNMKIKKWQRKLMYLEIMYSYASSFKDVTLMFRREFFLLASTTYQLFNSLIRLCKWIIRETYTYYPKYTHYQKSNIRTNLYNQKIWFNKDYYVFIFQYTVDCIQQMNMKVFLKFLCVMKILKNNSLLSCMWTILRTL